MVKCTKCNSEISEQRAWTLVARDYENPKYFCSDQHRTSWVNNPKTDTTNAK